MAVLDSAIHLGAVVDAGTVIIDFLVRVDAVMLFGTIGQLDRHADIAHIDANGALGALNQNVMLRPVEGRAILDDGVGVVAELQIQEQHIVLIAKLRAGVGNIAAGHGNTGCGSHDELDAVQLMDVVIQMAAGLGADLLPADRGLRLLPAVTGRVGIQHLADAAFLNELLARRTPWKKFMT